MNLLLFHCLHELEVRAAIPWPITMQHFIEDDSQGPDITLGSIILLSQQLIRHVVGGPHDLIILFLLGPSHSKPKISKLALPIFHEDVRRFEVP